MPRVVRFETTASHSTLQIEHDHHKFLLLAYNWARLAHLVRPPRACRTTHTDRNDAMSYAVGGNSARISLPDRGTQTCRMGPVGELF